MSECLSPTGAFNQFSSLPSIPYAIIEKLMENENIWKILKYPTYDCLSKKDLTLSEKSDMIWKNQENQVDYNVFLTPLVEDMIYESTTILKCYRYYSVPMNQLRAVVTYEIDVLYGGKISLIEYNGIPCNRSDVIEMEIMKTLNGADVGGIGYFQFNRELSSFSQSRMVLGNDKTFTGTAIVMATNLSNIKEDTCCG